jgi:glycosyltransferase involved in cell wall biosynthesis
VRISVFLSHPIQHFSPLWQELARRPGVELKVFYYSRHGLEESDDPGFGRKVRWDVDLLQGYQSEFLPRAWPTRNELDCSWRGLNSGFVRALASGWDAVYLAGYTHINHWRVVCLCSRFGLPLLYHSDSNCLHERNKSPVWRGLKSVLLARFFGHVTIFLASGDHNAAYLRMYGVPEERIVFCPIPVDLTRFQQAVGNFGAQERLALRAEYGLRPADFVVGYCGKMAPHKRPQDLITAAEAYGKDDVKVLFIGCGELEEQLRNRRCGHAKFAGFVNQSAVPHLLAVCDVLAMPSERDAHPLAVTEAQSLGLPVLLSDRCGCYGPNDVFRDGESGILYPCGDTATLAEGIRTLHRNPEKRRQMGCRGRELARTQSAAAAAQRFLEAAAKAREVFAISRH